MSTLSQRRAYTPNWQHINNMACAVFGIKPMTDADWIAADLAANTNKADEWHRSNDRASLTLQINSQEKIGAA